MNESRKNYLQRVYTPSMLRARLGKKDPKLAGWKQTLRSLALLGALVLVGVLFRDVVFGRIFIMIYGVIAIFAAIPAVQTFKMAAISIACLPVLGLAHSSSLSEIFAQYAFLLFLIGVICSIVENMKSSYLQRREIKLGIKSVAPTDNMP